MGGHDVREPARVDRLQEGSGRIVAEMTVATGDALLQRIRIASGREHVHVVVALDHERVAPGEACFDEGRRHPDVGQKAEAGARTLYELITKLRDKSASSEKDDNKQPVSAGQGTLTANDMAPAWRAPVPLPPRRETRSNGPAA